MTDRSCEANHNPSVDSQNDLLTADFGDTLETAVTSEILDTCSLSSTGRLQVENLPAESHRQAETQKESQIITNTITSSPTALSNMSNDYIDNNINEYNSSNNSATEYHFEPQNSNNQFIPSKELPIAGCNRPTNSSNDTDQLVDMYSKQKRQRRAPTRYSP